MPELDFATPDFGRHIDVEARIAATPESATIKGLMFKPLLRAAQASGGAAPGQGHYAAFTDYPLREFMQVQVAAARAAHPELPLGEGLRRLGRPVYRELRESAAGTFLFALAGGDLMASVRLVNRVYNMLTTARADSTVVDERQALIHLRGTHAFPEVYQAGIYEGALEVFGRQGDVRVRQLGPGNLDIQLLLA
jgi:uncharacterized protein (TIGR02265 family)